MCCICSMHVYSSALCLEWNDHSDVFFITEQHFLRLRCFMYRAIITICHLGARCMANLQSFDACNNYYYWCHCTLFKIWTSHCKSIANRKERQPVHTKTGNSLLVNIWKSVRWHSTGWVQGLREQKGDAIHVLASALRTALGNWALGSPDAIFWQSVFEVWPWTQPYGIFQATPAPRPLSNFICALCHWHSEGQYSFKPWFPDLIKQKTWKCLRALSCLSMKSGSE